MKIRNGFVSNSSTASFIVTFGAKSREEAERAIQLSEDNKYFNLIVRIDENGKAKIEHEDIEERLPVLDRNMFGYYDLELSTFMFNDWMDVDCWKFVRMLSEGKSEKFTLVQIIQTEEEYNDSYDYVSFDPRCWEVKNKGSKQRQKDIDEKYNQYLTMLEEERLL